jgi:cathepsin D
LTLNGQSIAIATGIDALSSIDSGTTHIGGPSADVRAFWAAVPNSAPSPSNKALFNFRAQLSHLRILYDFLC